MAAAVKDETAAKVKDKDATQQRQQRDPKEQAVADAFARQMIRESFKYEVGYVGILLILEIVHFLFYTDVVVLAPLVLRGSIVAYRWCCGKVDSPSWVVSVSSAALDAVIFIIAAELGANADTTERGVLLSEFLINIMLSYMVLFVFTLRKALVVAPLCFISYGADIAVNHKCFEGHCEGVNMATAVFGLALMGLGLCLNIVTKVSMERSKWLVFLVCEETKKQAISEKVLRFQAEFKQESLHSKWMRRFTDHASVSEPEKLEAGECRPAKPEEPPAVPEPPPPPKPVAGPGPSPSLHSAPTVMMNANNPGTAENSEDALNQAPCISGDCLPPEALVWLEGEALPKALAEVEAGHRVLCFDRLGGHLKHAQVLEARTQTGAAAWTTLTLEDGTVLELTADHPIQPARAATGHGRPVGPLDGSVPPVSAAMLKPDVDSLMVLKIVPIMVKDVQTKSEERPRVFLTVKQPERHAIFVAKPPGEGGSPMQPIAIESSNANGNSEGFNLLAKRTFLHCTGDNTSVGTPQVVPNSAPPSLNGGPDKAVMSPSSPRREISTCESGSSYESQMSGMSHGDTQVTVGGPLVPLWDRQRARVVGTEPGGRTTAVLTDFMGVKATGLASIGSMRHSADECLACRFENRRQHAGGKPCFKGIFCERCHEDHDEYRKWKGARLQQSNMKKDVHPAPLLGSPG